MMYNYYWNSRVRGIDRSAVECAIPQPDNNFSREKYYQEDKY